MLFVVRDVFAFVKDFSATLEMTRNVRFYGLSFIRNAVSIENYIKKQTPSVENTGDSSMVWIPKSGSKYHSKSSCSNMKNPSQVTEQEAIQRGYEPCKKCY